MAYLSQNLSELWLAVAGFDDLLLNGETTDADGFTFTIDAIDDGASWDAPEPIDVAVQRWMTDGAVAATQGHDNRTPTFQVCVSAATSANLAAAESALVKRSARPGSLKWVSPEGDPDAAASVFEVWTWHLSHAFSSSDERRLQRYYTLTFTAKPWVRSENLTIAPAPAVVGAPTTVQIDACTSTTGWSSPVNPPTTSGGAVKETSPIFGTVGDSSSAQLNRTGSVTGLGTTPYLQIDSTTTGGTLLFLVVSIDGTSLSKVAQIGTVSYWAVPAGVTSFTSLVILSTIRVVSGSPSNMVLSVADVSRTDTVGGIGSQKMLARSLDVGGSVKTSGSLHVASPSATTLGNCLIYTSADSGSGYTPPLRQYRTSGNTVTPDATCVSGSHEAFVTAGASAGTITYTLAANVLPEATYVVVGRFVFGAAATITTTLTSASNNVTGKVTAAGAGVGWGVIGALSLPGRAYPAEALSPVLILASGTATTGTHTLDELFLIDVTNGGMSLVLNVAQTNLWLDAPDADPVRNRPAIYAGSQSDRSDAVTPDYATILSVGDHDLDPDGAVLFTVTDGVDNAAVTGSFYRRWHTHAGD